MRYSRAISASAPFAAVIDLRGLGIRTATDCAVRLYHADILSHISLYVNAYFKKN